MPKLVRKRRSKKSGMPPGSLYHLGNNRKEKVRITLIDYDESDFREKEAAGMDECFPLRGKPAVTWLNIDGVHEGTVIGELGKHLNIHPLVLEDVMNTDQRPKMEDYDDYLFVVVRMIGFDARADEMTSEQVSFILGKGHVISLQEKEGDIFEQVRERIRKGKGRIRKMDADYLLYSLLDAVVDNYFIALERFGEKIEDVQEEVIKDPSPKTLQDIYDMKGEMIFLRKSIWPLREVLSGLQKEDPGLITEGTKLYLRDVYDHTIQVMETIETFRDMVSGMIDIYMSSISNRMNEVMKVLTVFASIFIPLTFIVGVYGMNFEWMPELKVWWAYPLLWILMLSMAGSMLLYFRRKKWI
ncbi:MAG: magnesium/cobalt transporter CorA [Candidatus Altiarchaeota archaeon]|nr:magnesium/cobalt transporter CorA [Candidatus Altiarchaeota archaeon]